MSRIAVFLLIALIAVVAVAFPADDERSQVLSRLDRAAAPEADPKAAATASHHHHGHGHGHGHRYHHYRHGRDAGNFANSGANVEFASL